MDHGWGEVYSTNMVLIVLVLVLVIVARLSIVQSNACLSAFAKGFNSAVPVSNINHVSKKLNGLLAKIV